MATPGWRTGHPLREQWREQHAGFDYYQLVSLLLRDQSEGRPVHFRADLSGAFPGHEVSGLEEGSDGAVTVASANYSVASALGPLPEPYTELARERAARGDRAMADFLDLFNHRLHAIRFGIKARFRPGLVASKPEQTVLGGQLGAMLGAPAEQGQKLPLPRRALLAMAGLLADRRRSAAAVEAVLRAWLEAPVSVEQMRGAWQAIPVDSQTRLRTRNTHLGESTVLGTRAWDQQARIGIRIGPLSAEGFARLMPGGPGHGELVSLVRFLTDRAVDAEVCVATVSDGMRLARESARLGFRSRLGAGPHEGEACFVIRAFDLEEAA